MNEPEISSIETLLQGGRSAGQTVALVQGQPKTWEDFLREASAWKSAALSMGSPKRAALYFSETWNFACALFGAWSAGLEVSIPGDALDASCQALAPEVDLFLGDFPASVTKPLLKSVQPSGSGLPGWPKLQDRVCLRVFTSGSTGKPEAFSKSFAQLSAEVACLEASFGSRLGSAGILATVSHQHIYGLLFKVLWPLCAGREILSQTLFFPEEILAASRRFPSAALISSPAHLKRLPDSLDWAAVQGQWRAVFSSGGPLPWEAAQLSQKLLGQSPLEVYGSSETGGIAWRERVAEQSPWTPFGDVALELDAASQTLKVRSPKLPDTNWFQTSDKVRFLEGGSFELLGRQDRILKIEEKRISLNAIEAALIGSGLASQASVLPLGSQRESLAAVLVLSSSGAKLERKTLLAGLRQALANKIERVGIPKRWRFVQALPLNAQGKVTQDGLAKLFEGADEAP